MFWKHGPMTGRVLHEKMAESALAYNTVVTICNRLVDKGLLARQLVKEPATHERSAFVGYIYTPLMSQETLVERANEQCRDTMYVTLPPAPRTLVDATPTREQIERVLAYLGSLCDANGQRADDAALDIVAALLLRAETAELRARAWEEEARQAECARQAAELRAEAVAWRAEKELPPLRLRTPDHAPFHEYRDPSGVCRVCSCAVPSWQNRQDGLRVCTKAECRKEAMRRDAVYKQRRYHARKCGAATRTEELPAPGMTALSDA
jgi:predicted transcriptional regulator